MRRIQWMALSLGVLAIGLIVRPAAAQPGHAPFVYAPGELDNFERALEPAGTPGATILSPGASAALSHRAVVQAGNVAIPYVTGAPLFLEEAHSTYEQFGGILGHVPVAAKVASNNYNDIFPGGLAISPNGFPNGGATNNFPSAINVTPGQQDAYNGTKISLVTNTDGNTADDVGITSGNQAIRVSCWNVGHGDGNTSFDRPVMLVIKPTDFWGVADSRYAAWEAVRAAPNDWSIAVDVTVLANEVPDTFDNTPIGGTPVGPYLRLGFISGNQNNYDESPASLLQGPDTLLFSNGDADGDMLPNFSDPQYVDPNNTPGLPGVGKAGVIQRRYVFPANAMEFDPPTPPTADNNLRWSAGTGGTNPAPGGGGNDAYALGFVFNGNWTVTDPINGDGVADGTFGDPVSFTQYFASFIVDNMRFLDRFPTASADFNHDGFVNSLDWNILRTNLNTLSAVTFEDGDIGQAAGGEEAAITPGFVDFQDFIRFEEIYDKKNGGAGAFQRMASGVPEPSSVLLVLIGLGALTCWRRRPSRRVAAALVTTAIALGASNASAALTDTLLFSFESGDYPDQLQRWVSPQTAGVDNATLAVNATGATIGTQALAITQTAASTSGATFTNVGTVSIFGSTSGLPPQADAFNTALDVGANNYVLKMDVTLLDAEIPPTSEIKMSVGLSAGSATFDTVSDVFIRGDGGGGVPNDLIHLAIPLSVLPVNTMDTVLSVPTQQGLAGSYNITVGLAGDWAMPATVHIDNVRLTQVTQPPKLTLEVNRNTGIGTIKNVDGPDAGTGSVTFDYYQIDSATTFHAYDFNDDGRVNQADYNVWRDTFGSTTDLRADGNADLVVNDLDYNGWKTNYGATGQTPSLNPSGTWASTTSLDARNTDAVDGTDGGTTPGDSILEGWDRSLSPSAEHLTEAFLLGSSVWIDDESLSLGNIFTPGGSENLVFRYREPTRRDFLVTGLVTYVNSGGGSVGGQGVPEPGTMLLALLAGLGIAVIRNNRAGA